MAQIRAMRPGAQREGHVLQPVPGRREVRVPHAAQRTAEHGVALLVACVDAIGVAGVAQPQRASHPRACRFAAARQLGVHRHRTREASGGAGNLAGEHPSLAPNIVQCTTRPL